MVPANVSALFHTVYAVMYFKYRKEDSRGEPLGRALLVVPANVSRLLFLSFCVLLVAPANVSGLSHPVSAQNAENSGCGRPVLWDLDCCSCRVKEKKEFDLSWRAWA